MDIIIAPKYVYYNSSERTFIDIAFLGGFIGSLLGIGDVSGFNLISFILAIGGAILLLVLYRAIKR